MKKKHLFLVAAFSFSLLVACNSDSNQESTDDTEETTETTETTSSMSTDPKGIGPYENVELTHPLDESMVATGKQVYELKCSSCHKLNNERVVGPGWAGVTDRRTPEWIMNFIVNVDEMLDKDTASQRMLEECLVRMPNQGLSESDARGVLEFMRKNDGKN